MGLLRNGANGEEGVSTVITVITQRGRKVEVTSQSELRDPCDMGEHIRAYCHIHGSDHQRSLSIDPLTGWGHCFNATCNATILVVEWNPGVAKSLLSERHPAGQRGAAAARKTMVQKLLPFRMQPYLPQRPRSRPKWQQDELATLRALEEPMHRALAHSEQAQRYLAERKIPLEIALAAGVGYLPPAALQAPRLQGRRTVLRRWSERIVFPLASPESRGYIGRSLSYWRPGMDENVHKAVLEQARRPKRWIKTNPAGWFGYEPDHLSSHIILVEGAFDRLTLLAAGLAPESVVALVGTAAQVDWFPPQVEAIVLALDGDEGGTHATRRLTDEFEQAGLYVRRCPPPADERGKDWNERWRHIGPPSVWPILETFSALRSA